MDGSPLAGGRRHRSGARPGDAWKRRPARRRSEWAKTSVNRSRNRAAISRKVKRRLLERADEIAELLHRECGKPIEEAVLAEVLPNADLVDYWTASIEELLDGAIVELDALAYPGKLGRVLRDPRGVIALITPWNYPVAIPLRTLIPALLAGNAVVWKPSEITPRSGALVASLFADILPEGLLQVAQGGGEVGAALIDADVDLVVFTGSVETGRKIAVAAAEQLIPSSLELGGKDAAIVLRDCRLERTARGLVWGAFTNAGQNCASIERVYVERAIADKLIARVVELTKELRPGVDTAGLTTARQAGIVRRHLEEAIASGAELLAGGAPEEPSDLAFPPTVLKVVDEDTPLMREETFGPILPVVVVEDEEEALRRADASRFGLTTSVWTRPRQPRARRSPRRLKSGVVTINNHGFTAAIPAAAVDGHGRQRLRRHQQPARPRRAHPGALRPRGSGRAKQARTVVGTPTRPCCAKIAFAMARARGGAGLFGRIAAFFQLLGTLPKRLLGG